jgi:hypothetical protein
MKITSNEALVTRLLAWTYLFIGTGGLAGGIFVAAGLWLQGLAGRDAFARFLVLFLVAALIFLLPALVGGFGLLFRRPWGRIVGAIVSAMLLLLFPVGTAVGIFGLWVLIGSREARDQWSSRDASPSSMVR